MNPKTYDIGLTVGLIACSLGAYLQAGVGVALLVFGGLAIALTFASAYLTIRITGNS